MFFFLLVFSFGAYLYLGGEGPEYCATELSVDTTRLNPLAGHSSRSDCPVTGLETIIITWRYLVPLKFEVD